VKNLDRKTLQKLILQEARKLKTERREVVELNESRSSRNTLRRMILSEAKKMGLGDAPKQSWPRHDSNTKDLANVAEFSPMKVDKEAAKLVSHSCANHVLMESESDEKRHGLAGNLGKCVWHSLDESGKVSHYDVQFGSKLIKNVPAQRLIVVSEANHMHETRPKRKSKKK